MGTGKYKVTATNISKRYTENKGIGPVSVEFETGNIYAVIGSNGCGKTTLIRCLCKLEEIQTGEIKYNAPESSRNLLFSTVFQSPEPWSHLTVFDNIALPLKKVLKMSDSDAKQRAEEILEKFGLSDRLKSFSNQLSGGLKQRVVQARTFAMQPTFLYLDEPTSALDPEWSDSFGKIAREYANSGKMVLVVAHQMNFLKKIADKVIYLNNGFIVEEGAPDQIFNHPQNESLIRFIENA